MTSLSMEIKGIFRRICSNKSVINEHEIELDVDLNHILEGDEILFKDSSNIDIIKRTECYIVGVLQLENIKLQGHTKKGIPIYDMRPLSWKYPKFYVASKSQSKRNLLIVAKFMEWNPSSKYPQATCIDIIGEADDPIAYDKALIIKNELYIKSYPTLHLPHFPPLPPHCPALAEAYITVIDPSGSTDCDDGFHITEDKLYVHIADVDHYFPANGPYEAEIRKRLTSIYSLTKVYHMLPVEYASNIISLNLNGPKHVLTAVFTHAGEFLQVKKSIVRVEKQLTYEAAQELFNSGDTTLQSLASITGETDTHKMIEKIMIWTNSAIGKLLFNEGVNFSVYCEGKKHTGAEESEDLPYWVIERGISTSSYSTTKHGHSMMGLEYYTHFTSPIRRYADLIVHRLVKQIIAGSEERRGPKPDTSGLEDYAALMNAYMIKVKHYYRDRNIYELLLKLNGEQCVTKGYVIDYNKDTNIVSVYLSEYKLIYSYPLCSWKLRDINKVYEIELFKPIDVMLTPIKSQSRIRMTIGSMSFSSDDLF